MKQQGTKHAGQNGGRCPEPTMYELASIAATLSWHSSSEFAPSSRDLVERALDVWAEAHKALEKRRQNPTNSSPPELTPTPTMPEPRSYPVNLDSFLRIVLPNCSGKTGHKFGLFREYLKSLLSNPPPAPRAGSGVRYDPRIHSHPYDPFIP